MAPLFKPKHPKLRTVKGPDGKPVTEERIAKRGANAGKAIRAVKRVPVLGRDGKAVYAQSKRWYVRYVDADEISRDVPGFTDRAATLQLAAQLERDAAREQSGLVDRFAVHCRRPLGKHLDDYAEHLQHVNASPRHIATSIPRIRNVLAGCRFTRWTDISASKVEKFIAAMGVPDEDGQSRSVQTRNHILTSVKAFLNWLVQDARAASNPLQHLRRANVATDRRHDRRALEADQLRRLVHMAAGGPIKYGMEGDRRALCFALVAETEFTRRRAKKLHTCFVRSRGAIAGCHGAGELQQTSPA